MMKNPSSEGHIFKRLNMPEIYMVTATLLWAITNTPLNGMFAQVVGDARTAGFLWYCSGNLLLSSLLYRSVISQKKCMRLPQTVQRIVGAFGAFCLLFIVDVLLSTRDPFLFAEKGGLLWALTPFFIIVLFLNRTTCDRLVTMVAVALGIQATYLAIECFLVWHYRTASSFGTQISRAVYDISAGYSLCLVGAPLCLVLAMSGRPRWLRIYCLFAFTACEAVLVLNNWRTAWIGASVSIGYLLVSRLSPLSSLAFWKRAGACMVVALITGSICVQARGDFSGAYTAPANLQRSQTVEVNRRVLESDFLLGRGLSTRSGHDRSTHREGSFGSTGFNLIKIDPESLYIRLVYDFGIVGLVLFLYVTWVCARYESDLTDDETLNNADRWLISGVHAGLLALLVAGLSDAPIFQEDRFGTTFLTALLLGISLSVGRDVLPVRERIISSFLGRYGKGLGYIGGSMLLIISAWQVSATALLVRSVMPTLSKLVGKIRNAHPRLPEALVPSRLQDAAVAAEDIHFYQHHGIDWESLHRALRRDIRAGHVVQGGSTITMQVSRYLFLSEQKTVRRKLAELYIAAYLEKRLTKGQILRLYVQNVDFGMHSPGVDRAAMTFFGKSPDQLTLGEAAYLVGNLPKPPASPVEAEADSAEVRRLSVLGKIESCFPGKYSVAERQAAYDEKLVFVWQDRQKQIQ